MIADKYKSRSCLVEVWHNVLWSRYKGRVFSELALLSKPNSVIFSFVQHAETEADRVGLGEIDVSYHKYSFDLLFPGNIDAVPAIRLVARVVARTLRSKADFVIIAGYSRIENWAQLLTLILMGRSRGVFCDSTLNDQQPKYFRSVAKRFFFRRCQIIFCYGDRSRDLVLAHGGRRESIVTRCQAAALPAKYDVQSVINYRIKLQPQLSLLYVGRLSKEKNLEALLSSFSILLMSHPNARLRIVGNGPDKEALIQRASALSAKTAIFFVGSKSPEDLAKEYLNASFLVLPSLSEPWGLVVNEALSYGCPVLVSDRCGCVPELVEPGGVGLTFDPHDIQDLTDKMKLMISSFHSPKSDAERCIEIVSKFSPKHAAMQIYEGITRYWTRSGRKYSS